MTARHSLINQFRPNIPISPLKLLEAERLSVLPWDQEGT